MRRRGATWKSTATSPAAIRTRCCRSSTAAARPWAAGCCGAGCTAPCAIRGVLEARLDAVAGAAEELPLRGPARPLKPIGDVERIMTRVALGSARPRDLCRLLLACSAAARAAQRRPGLPAARWQASAELGEFPRPRGPPGPRAHRQPAGGHPRRRRDRPGFDEELDELRGISENAADVLLADRDRERERTGLSLAQGRLQPRARLLHRAGRSQSERAPGDYQRRQTLKNVERFITPELKEFEDKALSSKSRALAREKAALRGLLDSLQRGLAALRASAAAMAELDVYATLAERAQSLELAARRFSDAPARGRAGTAPGGRTGRRRAVSSPTTRCSTTAPHAADHRPEHGRQVDLYAPERADRAAGLCRQLRAGAGRALSVGGPHLHAHRRRRRPGQRPLDLHGGDDRDRQHPAQRQRAQPGADG
jgi:hypothetical protein